MTRTASIAQTISSVAAVGSTPTDPASAPWAFERASSVRGGRRRVAAAAVGAAAALALGVAAPASADGEGTAGGGRPDTIVLPNELVAGDAGFQPEGIEVVGGTAYAGSLVDGTIVTAELRSGTVRPFVAPDGDPAVGLEATRELLLVAGGPSGELRAYDRRTGATVGVADVAAAGFVNDVAVIGSTAYFTDSARAVLYALPLGRGTIGAPVEVPLSGDFVLNPSPEAFNANGIAALDGRSLIVAQSDDPDGTGSALYRVDAATGAASRIAVDGGDVENADGVIVRGRTVWVVQNRSNSIAQLRLSRDGTVAHLERVITDERFAVPTTGDVGPRGDLYLVNARFGTPPSDAVDYRIVRVDLRRG